MLSSQIIELHVSSCSGCLFIHDNDMENEGILLFLFDLGILYGYCYNIAYFCACICIHINYALTTALTERYHSIHSIFCLNGKYGRKKEIG